MPVRLLLACVVAFVLTGRTPAAPAAVPEPLLVLPWNTGGGPTLSGPTTEAASRGPAALALDAAGRVWILDTLSQRLLVYDRAGDRRPGVALPRGTWDGLALGPAGDAAVLCRAERRIRLAADHGPPLPVSRHVGPLTALGWGADGLDVENLHGERFALGTPADPRPERAALLGRRRGPAGSAIDCGVDVKDGRATLLCGAMSGAWTDGRWRPAVAFALPWRDVAAARPVTACTTNEVLLRVDRRTGAGTSRSWTLIRQGQVEATWTLGGPDLYVPFGQVAREGAEVVWLHPTPEALHVLHARLP